jgi:hypothetical protein
MAAFQNRFDHEEILKGEIMNLHIDLKSLLMGIGLVVCVLLAVGASTPAIPHHAGRYQLVALKGSVAFVLDSHTGRVWRKYSSRSEFTELKIDTRLPADDNR